MEDIWHFVFFLVRIWWFITKNRQPLFEGACHKKTDGLTIAIVMVLFTSKTAVALPTFTLKLSSSW